MLRIVVIALKALCFFLALGWLALIFFAQKTCSILPSVGHQCHGPDLDVWMLPIVCAFLGLPALAASIVIIVTRRRRKPVRPERA